LLLAGNGLIIKDLKKGHGPAAKSGDWVTVNYTGKLKTGKVFDSSLNKGRTPFVFHLGAHQVIKGWDQGVAGMKVGGRRRLTIPPDLAYGDRQMGPDIAPNSTLIFDVELLKISKTAPAGAQ
jgi:FKBP-type peptidyl-prolyl cis-trans isomerase